MKGRLNLLLAKMMLALKLSDWDSDLESPLSLPLYAFSIHHLPTSNSLTGLSTTFPHILPNPRRLPRKDKIRR
jgi:hypothetical protein